MRHYKNIRNFLRNILTKENMSDKGTSPREEACESIMYEGFTLFPFP